MPAAAMAAAATSGVRVASALNGASLKDATAAGVAAALNGAAGGAVSGVCAATTSAPWDLIKTRVQNDSTGQYKGVVDCLVKTVRQEGPLGLYKGWLALYLRLGPAVIVQVPMIEYGRHLFGLSAFGVVE